MRPQSREAETSSPRQIGSENWSVNETRSDTSHAIQTSLHLMLFLNWPKCGHVCTGKHTHVQRRRGLNARQRGMRSICRCPPSWNAFHPAPSPCPIILSPVQNGARECCSPHRMKMPVPQAIKLLASIVTLFVLTSHVSLPFTWFSTVF